VKMKTILLVAGAVAIFHYILLKSFLSKSLLI